MIKIGQSGKYIVLRGLNYRVKFTVNDNSKWVKQGNGTPRYKTQFTVETLDNKYNPNTSFSSGGTIEYYGGNFWEAWNTVQKYVFNAILPKEFEKYALGEQQVFDEKS